jgi:hypothetical protein
MRSPRFYQLLSPKGTEVCRTSSPQTLHEFPRHSLKRLVVMSFPKGGKELFSYDKEFSHKTREYSKRKVLTSFAKNLDGHLAI